MKNHFFYCFLRITFDDGFGELSFDVLAQSKLKNCTFGQLHIRTLGPTRDFDSVTTKVHRGTKMAQNTCFETSFSNIKREIIFPVRFNEINIDF